ncbi:MAG: YibE/F family protein [Euzebya sp.]
MTGIRRRQQALTAFVLGLAVLTVIGLAVLYPYGGPPEADQQGFAQQGEAPIDAEILAVRELGPADDGFSLPGAIAVSVDVRTDDGRRLTIETVDETGGYAPGKAVRIAQINAVDLEEQYAIVDFQRGLPLALLAVAFGLAVIMLGRWQGVRALIGLVASALLIVGFAIPALLAGRDPTLVAIVVAMAVMLVTLPLSHGWSLTTKAAVAGTAVALLSTVGLALLSVEATNLTGLSSEDVQFLRFATGQAVDVRGLLLAGIIVGTLGVLDDVTVSQVSTVAALRRADPSASDRRIFSEALRVGRDHIAATVNTLFLAYAGATLPLLILFTVGGGPIAETLTSELVAQEIVRTMVGSIGLVLAVPFTTAVAAATMDPRAPLAHAHGALVTDRVVVPARTTRPTPVASSESPADGTPPDTAKGDSPSKDTEWEESLRNAYGLDESP